MTPATIIIEARTDQVFLSLTPVGNLKLVGQDWAITRWGPTIQAHRQALIDKLKSDLSFFRFDLVEQEIAKGYPPEELRRVNNLCWELMGADGVEFRTAMRIAAEIVVICPPAECEQIYADAFLLWESLICNQ